MDLGLQQQREPKKRGRGNIEWVDNGNMRGKKRKNQNI